MMSGFDSFAQDYKVVLDRSLEWSGETGDYFAGYKARYVRDHIVGQLFSGSILDFGCGVGLLSSSLQVHLPAAAIHGFDVSAESIRRVNDNLRAKGLFTSDLTQVKKDYDVIVLSNVLHHVAPGERCSLVSAVSQHLSGGGRLVVFEHNPINPVTRYVVKRSPLDQDAVLLRCKETIMLLSDAGMRSRRAYIVFFPRSLAWLRGLEPFLTQCPLGAQYVVVGHHA
jgi:2-polyprenyl-3-methyl-5-hydroxy-6-metoxy-1,4-benzoquinol methylase